MPSIKRTSLTVASAWNEGDVAKAIACHLGVTVRCDRLEDSSGGGAYLVRHESEKWVAKVFPDDARRVAARSIDILIRLRTRKFSAPRLVCDELISFGGRHCYIYEYIAGSCLRDEIQPVSVYQATASLIDRLGTVLRECWDEGVFSRDSFDVFDLQSNLDQGIQFLSTTSQDLASEARRRAWPVTDTQDSAAFGPVHADLHMGNVLHAQCGLVPIDFDSVCLSYPEKAFAALVGKIYEQEMAALRRRSLIAAVIDAGARERVGLDSSLIRTCALEKKLAEIRYLDRVTPGAEAQRRRVAEFRSEALRGLGALLREWELFPTQQRRMY